MSKGFWIFVLCFITNITSILSAPKILAPSLITSIPKCPSLPLWEDLKPALQDLTAKPRTIPNFQQLKDLFKSKDCKDNIVELDADELSLNQTDILDAKIDLQEDITKAEDFKQTLGPTPSFIPIFRPRMQQKSTLNQQENKDLVVQFVKQGNSKPVLKSVALSSPADGNSGESPSNVLPSNTPPPNTAPLNTVLPNPSNGIPLNNARSSTGNVTLLKTIPSNVPLINVPSNTAALNNPSKSIAVNAFNSVVSIPEPIEDCKDLTNKCVDGNKKADFILFKPETVSLLNVYGDFLKKVTMTVLVPMYASKLDL